MRLLEELTKEEDRLLAIIHGLNRGFRERSVWLEENGIYQAYRIVHKEYVELAVNGNLEALKRSIFLQWYSWSEPNEFTGLLQLEENSCQKVLELLDEKASEDAFDDEFRIMLPYYYEVTDYYFDLKEGYETLKAWLRERASWNTENNKKYPDLLCQFFIKPSLVDRGQMSCYWYRPTHFPTI